nr:MYCBP-associated protein-like [Nomia melanderi]
MDYARKIGKSDKPKEWRKEMPTSVLTSDPTFKKDRPHAEDPPLINWKKWLANRRKQYKHIKSSSGRHQTDQIMNACETIRPLIEMRNLMDYANSPVVSDSVRGGPEFWKTPQALSNRGEQCLPDVTVTPSKKELNVLPELMYVDLPELIEKEKDLVSLKSKEPLWKRSQYLMDRKAQLSKEIQSLVPKEPETKHLVIQGRAPQPKTKPTRIPVITVSNDSFKEDEEEAECEPEVLQEQAVVLRIQDREIVWKRRVSERGKADAISWNVTFSSQVNRRQEKQIELENKGNRVIIYEWRDASCVPTTIPLKRRVSPFFFNKTKEVILPGQIVQLTFWYRPRVSGVSSELWRFKTDPELCPSPLLFRLSGCSDTAPVDSNIRNDVDEYLDGCIRDSTVRDVINEILEDMYSVKSCEPYYGSLFLESEVFLTKNPLCFYHPSVVTEFHKLYYAATKPKNQRWNMCIEDLREILLKINQPDRRRDMLSEFSRLYKECLKPTLRIPDPYTKHEMVYNLFCSFFNRFEVESEYAKRACFAKEDKVDVTVSEVVNIKPTTSQVTIKSNSTRNKRSRRSTASAQSIQVQEAIKKSSLVINTRPYKEVFFIRVREQLEVTLKQIIATIDSFNNLNQSDK